MYERVNVKELKLMARLASRTPDLALHHAPRKGHRFSMGNWMTMRYTVRDAFGRRTPCGTAGCLVGTWLYHQIVENHYSPERITEEVVGRVKYACEELGLPVLVYNFLFMLVDNCMLASPSAIELNRDQAVARLKKYIKYVERKKLLFQEHEELMALSRKDRRLRLLSKREPVLV